jgi:fumarylpyruvate hydrolase
MSGYVIDPPAIVSVPINASALRFAVRRVYCVGRNYAEHAAEMGAQIDRGRPVFFSKPADALVTDDADVHYPLATELLHHEVELVVALSGGGRPQNRDQALALIYGYAVGNDLTRRDLQHQCKAKGLPWDIAKGFDQSAPISAIRPVAESGHPEHGEIRLEVNGVVRQRADLRDMVWSVSDILIELGKLYTLAAGDLVFMGTPAGVGELKASDQVHASIEGVGTLRHRVL